MKWIKALLKTALAGIVAIAILCILFAPYVFTPIHKANPLGNTDYIWPGGAAWHKMTEGISHGKFDANGYNNPAVIENPDILLLGSSHMEAIDVNQDENTAYVLSQLLPERHVYNMAISGHNLLKICKYLPTTLTLYPNEPEFIVIETANVRFTQEDVDALLQGNIEYTASFDTGLIAALQRLPFPRMMYLQSAGLLDMLLEKTADSTPVQTAPVSEAAYDALFGYIRQVTAESNSKIIIVYHPTGQLQPDGSVSFEEADNSKALFAQKCAESGICFVDMAQPFTQLYDTQHQLPHGFVTGKAGFGHLNQAGHKCIAQVLAETIQAIGKGEALCR